MADKSPDPAGVDAEGALAPFFAARGAEPAPRPALIAAILADAAAETSARAAARRWWRLPDLHRLLEPLGGLPAAAALGACALLGFTAGMAGSIDDLRLGIWSSTAAEAAEDPVVAFFDLGPEQ